MRALYYDVFKAGKDVTQAPPEVLEKENQLAWKSNVHEHNSRFFNITSDEDRDGHDIRGAVVHLSGFSSYESLMEFTQNVPWVKYGFADGRTIPFGNFVSLEKLFYQQGKYKTLEQIKRSHPFTSDPTVTWYVIISAKDISSYDTRFGLEDALQCYRLLKGKATT